MDETAEPRPVTCTTDDGVALEAEVAVPADARAAVVLCHPHPQHGGDMRSLVTSELFSALPEHAIAVLRFNFRGVGGSEGAYGEGVDEQRDVVAAIDAIAVAAPGLPVIVVGWSFGAEIASAVLDERIAGWVLVALPLRILPSGAHGAGEDERAVLVLQPERDQIRSPESLAPLVVAWRATTLEVIGGADHFLVGRTAEVAERTAAFVAAVAAAP